MGRDGANHSDKRPSNPPSNLTLPPLLPLPAMPMPALALGRPQQREYAV